MGKYRTNLPQSEDKLFMTDGGIETSLIFLEGQELPYFAAFHLLRNADGEALLRKYYETYAALAKTYSTGFILESPTWRASLDWGEKLGYSRDELAALNVRAIELMESIRTQYESSNSAFVISGCIGPRGDGYVPADMMSSDEADEYHSFQARIFSQGNADMITAVTMNYVDEAIGISLAAKRYGMPVVVSFTVETDGCLPTGQSLRDAIKQVDSETKDYPSYFMINCAHPSHFQHILEHDDVLSMRIKGVRANASKMSHAELNEAVELDAGSPSELALDYAFMRQHSLKKLNVIGGCCGTDHRHVESMAKSCIGLFGF